MLSLNEIWKKLRRLFSVGKSEKVPVEIKDEKVPAEIKDVRQGGIDLETFEQKFSKSVEKALLGEKPEPEITLEKFSDPIEKILKENIFNYRNEAFIPDKFNFYVGPQHLIYWGSAKQKFFEERLSEVILERAQEMAGTAQLKPKKITVAFRENTQFLEDEIEIEASTESSIIRDFFIYPATIINDKTLTDFEINFLARYRIEIWQAGEKLEEYPIKFYEVIIGRDGYESVAGWHDDYLGKAVLILPTLDTKVGWEHAEISLEPDGDVWVKALDENPTIVSGQVIKKGEKAKLEPDGEIQVGDLFLRLKFPAEGKTN